ncbi:hypothetical protein [Photobacterium leiognathi]|uniref:hypothetical protein n=1 Tax=Photobacterium leiognathi TaxID=553611 RepID=UPI002981EB3A|nr:hypothetical protein [Photobacterium leiognathi]
MYLKTFKLILYVYLSLFINVSYAVILDAKIVSERINWVSGHSDGDKVRPSNWDIPINIPVGSKFIPGGVLDSKQKNIEVTNKSGKKVTLPYQIVGVEYRLSSNNGIDSITGGSSSAVINGLDAVVSGSGISNTIVRLKHDMSPFTHFRPLLTINDDSWIKAFTDAGSKAGSYSGTIHYTTVYDYYRNGSRIRNHVKSSLTLVINYNPLVLNNITVTGSDVLETTYHSSMLVSGETIYTVEATGYFIDGIWLGLAPLTDSKYYSLKSKSITNDNEIKYSVTCVSGCDGNENIIVDGAPNIDNTTKRTIIHAVDTKSAIAKLKVSFDRIPLVNTDTYYGSFILIFEPRI